jgi:hypothetical protein
MRDEATANQGSDEIGSYIFKFIEMLPQSLRTGTYMICGFTSFINQFQNMTILW